MKIHNLTDVQCKNAVCTSTAKYAVRKMADGGGLFLWITPDGAKRWRYRYFTGGKEGLLSVGVYPEVTLKDARAKAAELRKLADPGAARKAVKQAEKVVVGTTFKAVATDWLAEREKHWTVKSTHDTRTRLETYVYPLIGDTPISTIRKSDILSVLKSMERQGTTSLAYRMLPILARIFRWAVIEERIEHSPLADITSKDLTERLGKLEHGQQPAVPIEELPALLRAINGYENRQVRLALKLIFLVFTRANEMLMGEWSEIDFDKALWRIPETRMKKRLSLLVPLSAQSLSILKELKEISCDSRYVFPGRSFEKPLSSKSLLDAFKILGYAGLQTSHGVRRLASTALNEAHDADKQPLFHKDCVERQMAHVAGKKESSRAAYNEALYLPLRKVMMQFWADHLDEVAKIGQTI